MFKINNKLILILGILIFIFGLSLASFADARTATVQSGVIFTPYEYPVEYLPATRPVENNNQTNVNNTSNSNSSSTYSNTNNNSNAANSVVSRTIDKNYNYNSNMVTDNQNENFSGLTANALGGSDSFMPTGLLQWIILGIIIAVIIFLWRYVFAEEKYMSEPMKHA